MNRPLSIVAAFGIAAMLLAPAASFAQSAPATVAAPAAPGAKHHHHGSRYMHALRGLNLSATQREQVKGFMQTARATMKTSDQATRRSTAKQLRAQIDGVLTPAQRTQLQSTLKQARPAAKPAT